jgi:uncharacterized alpha-E superfamily protein
MMLLRALSANRAFHWAYGGEITASKIADFLILNPQCPRALITCVAGANNHLARLAKRYGAETGAQTRAAELLAMLENATPVGIFDEGLHEFLSRFIGLTADLAVAIHDVYLSGDMH